MAKQTINLGLSINDGTGDSLRVGAQKINSNFTELYNSLTSDGNIPVSLVNNLTAGRALTVSSPSGQVTISANIASSNEFGVIKLGTGLTVSPDGVVSSQVYSLPIATSNTLGGVKIGDNLTIDNSGTLSAISTPYNLPTASPNVLGGIKIGNGLSVNQDGVLTISLGLATSVPETSKGQLGDVLGMFAVDTSYFYVCTADYTDGEADIWKRTQHTAGTW